ncbi:Por secretion system C-terminal sorting domain-containing protein [Saccharicrinis carchari]|uniref:Por secretion system C-terminal sorting domain-containing protein n=1 Tax=Saccharicrinis carchari TaxID=1168039 RepID=A0A521EY88_SACCC|nr:LamG-like jellyroll fold domain-containing protein [Saccharicrinis carchari]SMO88855.1 Por secretion system C-terminal sorting domain-containing protein [Saccharicrinis carchari]
MRYVNRIIPHWLIIIFSISASQLSGQQIDIPRISLMPNFPQPYEMRDWKKVAGGYDSIVFNQNLVGEHLPLVFSRNNSLNYPGLPSFGLHTAVGTNAPSSGEAINVIPAVVGASLVGIDKTNQFGNNWVSMVREFFNKRPQENIYLNHPQTSSGNDWWYETMPNVFFMQLKDLYPEIQIFDDQLPVMANQWMRALRKMGASDTPWASPYMNYRAWSMSTMDPLDEGVKQPEAAGAIAWILYNTYVETGQKEYLKGAEWAMEFLNEWADNPSYELQLPYGVYTAARMNAEMATRYDIEKMVNWCFDRGDLRGWGAIVGRWGDLDCSGLIGEANDNGNDYAFLMNGFQQAGALVPMLRYDERFSKSIAKWVLNMANASRLLYPAYLPPNMQDNATWSETYDPNSYIAYEALREVKNNEEPYATGDAIAGGWAQTNLMLYGSSHVGTLAAIIDTTNIEGILQLDLLKTDYFGQEAFPSYLYYNPFEQAHSVNFYLPEGTFKLYDAISNQFIGHGQSGVSSIELSAGSAVMIVIVPQEAEIEYTNNKTIANGVIIDFNNGLPTENLPPRIKALASADSTLEINKSTTIYCTAYDANNEELTYSWFIGNSVSMATSEIKYDAPKDVGKYTIACKVENKSGLTDSLSIQIDVVERIPHPPKILSITATPRKCKPGEKIALLCNAQDYYNDPLQYAWETKLSGAIAGDGESVTLTAPEEEGNYYILCKVSNPDNLFAKDSVQIIVRDFQDNPAGDRVAFYKLRGNADDDSGNNLHGIVGGGITWTDDMNGNNNHAARFDGSSANILMPSSEKLNFSEEISISIFLKIDELSTKEQHPISHGSWENRFKISITDNKLRFTVNSSESIRDLDSESSLTAGEWYHVVALYDGVNMEIWLNGELDSFANHSGTINQSPVNMVLGQNLPGNNEYNFMGDMAMVSIFNFALTPAQINKVQLLEDVGITHPSTNKDLVIYPNPVNNLVVNLLFDTSDVEYVQYQIFDIKGSLAFYESHSLSDDGQTPLTINLPSSFLSGLYFLRILTNNKTLSTRFMISE